MLAATAIGIVGLPVLAPVSVAVDLLRGRRRLPTLRVYLFLLQYGVNDSVEIVLAPIYWVTAGFGLGLHRSASIARHRRLQMWSLDLLIRRAETLLGLRVDFDDKDLAALRPGPIIVLSRHVSPFDASLPGLLCDRAGLPVRGVIMAELLADPGFDLIYGRLGSVFIPRDNGPEARTAIRSMAEASEPDAAMVIFPEGRLFGASTRDRLLARLGERDPERAERLAGLQHVLPPRPGGVSALLNAAPEADVVLIDHRGLDDLVSMSDLVRRVPLDRTVSVDVRRILRADVPTDLDKQVAWLDTLWTGLDRGLKP